MNKIHRYVIKTADSLLNTILMIFLCVVGLYSVYSLWDNHQIIQAAENVMEDMLQYKPDIEDLGPTFEELLALNEDICAWVTLDNTQIDYPIVQGEDNLDYINTDVYGNFALAGSIFLDSRNSKDFTDAYSLVYGHHMAEGKMFGDLDLYKEKEFFEENTTGTLLLPDRAYDLDILACLVVNSRDEYIFEPDKWESDVSGIVRYAEQNALHTHEELLNTIKGQSDVQILSLSTCSSEYDDARTIVLAVMEPYIPD